MIEKLFDWVSLFINYQDMEIEDITFKLLKIEIPEGEGRVNRIITVRGKHSIIEIVNSDTLCLARAIVVGLASRAREHLESILKDKVTKSEMIQINKEKQNKSQINQGVISNNEVKYIKKGGSFRQS